MILQVQTTTLPDIIKPYQKVSLKTNGASVEILDARNFCRLCVVQHPVIEFRTNDPSEVVAKTEIELTGFHLRPDLSYKPVTFLFA